MSFPQKYAAQSIPASVTFNLFKEKYAYFKTVKNIKKLICNMNQESIEVYID